LQIWELQNRQGKLALLGLLNQRAVVPVPGRRWRRGGSRGAFVARHVCARLVAQFAAILQCRGAGAALPYPCRDRFFTTRENLEPDPCLPVRVIESDPARAPAAESALRRYPGRVGARAWFQAYPVIPGT
jgi:hypothetical protein